MEVEALTKLQDEVDAVINILNNNFEAIQNCNDSLLRRSEYISEQSECFEKTKKTEKRGIVAVNCYKTIPQRLVIVKHMAIKTLLCIHQTTSHYNYYYN
jgi:hypothetical protein